MSYFPAWQEIADYCAIPPEWLLEAGERFVVAQISIFESKLDDQLRNRYAVPFLQPNNSVKGWIAAQVTVEVLKRRGVDPTDTIYIEHKATAELARQEITAAADSDVGLFELPLLATDTPVARGMRKASDADPGAWKRRQGARATQERADWVDQQNGLGRRRS